MLNWHNSPVFDRGKSLSQWRVPNSILHSTAEYIFMAVCQPRDQPCDVSLPSFSTALTVSPVIISSSPAVKILRSNSAKAYSLPTCSNGKHTCGQNCGLTTTWVALASIPDFTRLPCLVDCWRWSLTAYLGCVGVRDQVQVTQQGTVRQPTLAFWRKSAMLTVPPLLTSAWSCRWCYAAVPSLVTKMHLVLLCTKCKSFSTNFNV